MRCLLLLVLCGLLTVCSTGSSGSEEQIPDEDTAYFGTLDAVSPQPDVTLPAAGDWYRGAVFYHIWVKAFADADGDGVGDIAGITSRLDYLNDGDAATHSDLGVNALWLSPIFACADHGDNMHGYDTTDYLAIDPQFGNEGDLKRLLLECHRRGMRVIFDFVPNHTSSAHPWFLDSRDNGTKRNWYTWQPHPDPNWTFPWGGGSWSDVWHFYSGSYYYGAFSAAMPDLNFANRDVRQTMANILVYWLNHGFDGMRVDAARYLFEDGPQQGADRPATHAFFKNLRKLVLEPYKDLGAAKIMTAEAWAGSAIIGQYFGGGGDEFHMCFDFPLAAMIRNAVVAVNPADVARLPAAIDDQLASYPAGYCMATFLSNHDNVLSRPASEYLGDSDKCKLAAAVNMLISGTPFIYYGNEIGMVDDPAYGGDQDRRLRSAFDWNEAGRQSADSRSILSAYRFLLRTKNKYESLRAGDYRKIPSSSDRSWAFLRRLGNETAFVVFNFAEKTADIRVDFSNTAVPQTDTSLIIGSLYDGSTTLTGENYRSFLISRIPAHGFRVYLIGPGEEPICADLQD